MPETHSAHIVLARKYRPRCFEEVMGQPLVIRALSNAFAQQKLHHAYLFTGTRGVGKTTIARIIAKCLNCEAGMSATPCGKCDTCEEIDKGRYIDLFEIDAASRTKVEDTRDLLDNVQYAPAKGRYKVYLIDEVHMLSGHSFNALLKTLEEPPQHVKFILATTDPQKLPATVLSRCMQFHLAQMPPDLVAKHLANVLTQEKVDFDQPALDLLGKAAAGSMRDGLSLTDQAIAFGNGEVKEDDVKAMLGTIDQTGLLRILEAIANKDASAMMTAVEHLVQQGVDFAKALAELTSILHHIALLQLVAGTEPESEDHANLAKLLSKADVQLFYQIGIVGQRDMAWAIQPRIGFEMTLLRMLAFEPTGSAATPSARPATSAKPRPLTTATPSSRGSEAPSSRAPQAPSSRGSTAGPNENTEKSSNCDSSSKPDTPTTMPSSWKEILSQLNLVGMSAQLAQHCALESKTADSLDLTVNPKHKALASDRNCQLIREALINTFKNQVKLTIKPGIIPSDETPAMQADRRQSEQLSAAESALREDKNVQQLLETFDATIVKESIKPKD